MKIFHLADLHIGKIVNNYSMIEDQEYILNEIINYINKEAPKAIIIAGDIYDKPTPSAEAVKVFDKFLTELVTRQLVVFIISGNHDSPERLGFASSLIAHSNVYISSVFAGSPNKIQLTDEFGMINFYCLPFLKPQVVKYFYPDEAIDSYDDAIKAVIEKENIDKIERNILISHQFVIYKGDTPERSESEIIPIGGIDSIDGTSFDAFDYVALGHLHSAQKIGRQTMRYAGSPLKYSLSEINHKKSIVMLDVNEKDDIKLTLLPLMPRREMRKVRGKLDEVIMMAEGTTTEDYVLVILTDEEIIIDANEKIRVYYPNFMKVEYENIRSQAMYAQDKIVDVENKTSMELFEEFYLEQNGAAPDAEQYKIVTKLLQKLDENL